MNTKNLSVNTRENLPKIVDNSNLELMTTKQVASVLTVNERTVRRVAERLGLGQRLSETKNGRPGYGFTHQDVTLILDYMQKNNNRSDLSSTTVVEKTKTNLTPALKVQQFISSIDYNDESAVDMVTATITALSSNLIAALHGENKNLIKENKMLKHQVEYNEVIGCSRWSDVKKLLCIKDNWETVCQKLNFEDHVDYFKKCMGDDTHPTTLLPDSTIERIKKEYCKK